jgi:hypothetical protein
MRDRASSNEKFDLPPLPNFDDIDDNEEDLDNYKSNEMKDKNYFIMDD